MNHSLWNHFCLWSRRNITMSYQQAFCTASYFTNVSTWSFNPILTKLFCCENTIRNHTVWKLQGQRYYRYCDSPTILCVKFSRWVNTVYCTRCWLIQLTHCILRTPLYLCAGWLLLITDMVFFFVVECSLVIQEKYKHLGARVSKGGLSVESPGTSNIPCDMWSCDLDSCSDNTWYPSTCSQSGPQFTWPQLDNKRALALTVATKTYWNIVWIRGQFGGHLFSILS